MPTRIRAVLSVVVALVVIIVFYFENKAGSGALQWIALGLGALMLGAIWLFPEAEGTKD
jgi:hypothetical protein